ncbi:toprim domain-containing protein [Parvibaculum sp.]|uniref:DUF7146 domain-containing protein n=1 Tax=Parvibaculum sp. TaxID=2024848 RepID=UPI001B2D4753|nr:toprim domain-containing protein [Parvibaculum sp.]MBO6634422.1 toprim domain-containing protein [Parvibaculum sp.]MBO6679169.1 toprim domain-containing protein [Parvibaculum sp.]MBO6685644.1 toprim domain-containing protein [Parvibaculum sp.]
MTGNLKTWAAALGGEIAAGQILAPGPGHSKNDRSLAVRPDGAGGVIVHSFADDDWRACRDFVRERLGLESSHLYRNSLPPERRAVPPERKPQEPDDRTSRAVELWRQAEPLGDTALRYFARRGLARPTSAALRFHPSCPFGQGERLSCVIALMTDPRTAKPLGIHRTALTREGEKIGRKMLGPAGVVRLSPDDAVSEGLGIAEGIETALAVEQSGWRPIWACLSAGGIARLPVLPGVDALTIFADADDAGTRAANQCAEQWTAANAECRVVTAPRAGADWADYFSEARNAR